MKVNFNQTFKTFRGDDLVIEGVTQKISEVIGQALFNGQGLELTKDPIKDGAIKMRAFVLCTKIVQAHGEIEISTEEAGLIKQVAQFLTPGCFAQVVNLIEK